MAFAIRRCRGSDGSLVHHTQSLIEEIKSAERHWIRGIQHESFQAEMRYLQTNRTPKHLLVDQFGLFIDENIVRYRGSLNNSSLQLGTKNPMLLPHNHHYVKQLISDVHKKIHHSGIRFSREDRQLNRSYNVVSLVRRWMVLLTQQSTHLIYQVHKFQMIKHRG